MTCTEISFDSDGIRIFGNARNGRYARLLLQDFILVSLLNYNQQIPVREQNGGMKFDLIHIFKRAICAFNTMGNYKYTLV